MSSSSSRITPSPSASEPEENASVLKVEIAEETEAPLAPPMLEAVDVAKSFGGVQALKGVALTLRPGEVHGLVGANGAGKSTLIRILAGLMQPDRGQIRLDGVPVRLATPYQAAELGMSFIHQELAFVPGMNVIQNIMLGLPKKTRLGLIDWSAIARDVEPIARRVGIAAPLFANVKGLSTAENWLIAICRALARKARLIVMDEPTASLSTTESERLLSIVRGLSQSGVAVLYVSHRLSEILEISDAVTVFRDGQSVRRLRRDALSRTALVDAIVGRHVEAAAPVRRRVESREVVLKVDNLTRLPRVKGVSFSLRKGEVLGIGGLVGAGRSELMRLIYGADRVDAGTMTLRGAPFAPKSPSEAVRAGLGLVPEERRAEGLVLTKSLAFNMQIANLDAIVRSRRFPLIDTARREALSLAAVRDLTIKTQSVDAPVGRLSGGNQQKVLLGRWLVRAPEILILDEPTRGVDIGARSEIHKLVRDFADKGMAVLVVSSEPEELPDLCDRVLVMAEGRVVRELDGAALSRNAIIEASYAGANASAGSLP
jgi:ABC-type sugar transport system ATPase subunit